MNENQKFTPKYWVGHCVTSDDILPHTMSKSKAICERYMEEIYSDFWDCYDLEVILVEIKPVSLSHNQGELSEVLLDK